MNDEVLKMPIEKLNLSNHSYHVLKRAGYNYIFEISGFSIYNFLTLRNAGKKAANEIYNVVQAFINSDSIDENSFSNCKYNNSTLISEFYFNHEISRRTYTYLEKVGIYYLKDIWKIDINLCYLRYHLSNKVIRDIKYLRILNSESSNNIEESNSDLNNKDNNIHSLDINYFNKYSKYFDGVVNYFKDRDIALSSSTLSNRSAHALSMVGISYFSDLLLNIDSTDIKWRNIGKNSLNEIKQFITITLKKNLNNLNYILGLDLTKKYEFLESEIIRLLKRKKFKGLNLNYFIKVLSSFGDEEIKLCLGNLKEKGVIEYVDYKIYLKFPKVLLYVQENWTSIGLSETDFDILIKRLNGFTLTEIAKDFNITRERIRQKITKIFDIIDNFNQINGYGSFDEDFYAYFYSSYDIPSSAISYFKIDKQTLNYLKIKYNRGLKSLDDSITDENLPYPLRLSINSYLRRNYILVDDEYVKMQKMDVLISFLKNYVVVPTRFNLIIDKFNQWLTENHPTLDKFLIDEESDRGLITRVSESSFCLLSEGKNIRYYNIFNTDYERFINTLKLDRFKDIQISTYRLFNEFPDLMKEFNILNQYELHNYLKKTIPEDNEYNLVFSRMPTLNFGEFVMKEYIYNKIDQNPNINKVELQRLVCKELGMLPLTFSYCVHLEDFEKYYVNGKYNLLNCQRELEPKYAELLKEKLNKDFYFLKDVVSLYLEINPNGKEEDINTFSLNKAGIYCTENFVIRHYKNGLDYYNNLVYKNDIFEITSEVMEHTKISSFLSFLDKERKAKRIFKFKPKAFISMKKLEKNGVTIDDINDFLDSVYDFMDDESYYNISKLEKMFFKNNLLNLGFDDCFYVDILMNDERGRFLVSSISNVYVFCKADSKLMRPSWKGIIIYFLNKERSIFIDDLILKMKNELNINVKDKIPIIISISKEAGFYYDAIMDKIYINKLEYFKDLEE